MKILRNRVGNYLLLIFGSIIYGLSVGMFLEPKNIAPGGVTGVSIMVNSFSNISVGTLVLLINIPLLILAFFKLGKGFFLKTLITIIMVSFWIDFFSRFNNVTNEYILSSLAGGALLAVGIGLIFHGGGTTGGSDIIVKMLRNKYPHIKTGTLFIIIDGVIASASGIVFGDIEIAMYALIALFVCSSVLDIVLYGADEAKLVFIFSSNSKEILDKIITTLDAGASFVSGQGGYTKKETKIIICALKKQRLPKLNDLVKETDDKAFMVVSSASEIFGVGFKGYHKKQL
ncbi:MAG: YitT family protein [Clostridiales bacterium]|nr:YitT family protein [Clostridiales bacterium]